MLLRRLAVSDQPIGAGSKPPGGAPSAHVSVPTHPPEASLGAAESRELRADTPAPSPSQKKDAGIDSPSRCRLGKRPSSRPAATVAPNCAAIEIAASCVARQTTARAVLRLPLPCQAA
jgi:hypothetical protein